MNIEAKDLILVVLGIIGGSMHIKAFCQYHRQTILGISHPPKATFWLWIFISGLNWFSYFVSGDDWRLAILPAMSTVSLFVVFFLFVCKNKLSGLEFWDNIALVLSTIALITWSWCRFNRIGAIYTNCILQFSVIASFVPFYSRLLKGGEEERGPWPWFIFSGAYIFQLAAVLIEWKGFYMLPYPINCFFLHLIVGLLALKNIKKTKNRKEIWK
jgi:hypothetical protein